MSRLGFHPEFVSTCNLLKVFQAKIHEFLNDSGSACNMASEWVPPLRDVKML